MGDVPEDGLALFACSQGPKALLPKEGSPPVILYSIILRSATAVRYLSLVLA